MEVPKKRKKISGLRPELKRSRASLKNYAGVLRACLTTQAASNTECSHSANRPDTQIETATDLQLANKSPPQTAYCISGPNGVRKKRKCEAHHFTNYFISPNQLQIIWPTSPEEKPGRAKKELPSVDVLNQKKCTPT